VDRGEGVRRRHRDDEPSPPDPASTQLAIYCAWRLRGPVGAILGGLCFIVPGLVLILALSGGFLG
jgi:chromate transporter